MLLNELFSCYFLGFIQKHSGGVVVKSCVKDFIDWSLWFSRTWKMKMPWAAMATPLSITSSRSGWTCSLVCCSFFFSCFFWSLCTKISFCLPCSDPATLSYCSSQWSFSTLSSASQLSARCCGYAPRDAQTRRQWKEKKDSQFKNVFPCRWLSHPLVKKNRRIVLASFLLLITGVGKFSFVCRPGEAIMLPK